MTDAMDAADRITLARVETGLANLTKLVEELRDDLKNNVPTRAEWEVERQATERRLAALEAAKAPWWSVASLAIAAAVLLWQLAAPLVQAVLAR